MKKYALLLISIVCVLARVHAFTPTDGGLIVNLQQNDQILISVMIDHDNNPSTPDREYFVENYTRYTGDDYFTYDLNHERNRDGHFLRLVQQAAGATEPSPMSIWTVDTALTRVDVHNVAKAGANKNYSMGGISYTIWNDGRTLKTEEITGHTDIWRFYGDLEENLSNDRLCDVAFVIPTSRPTITSFDPNRTLSATYSSRRTRVRDDQDAQGRFNGKTGTGFLGMTYREVYWLESPRFNGPVVYDNFALVTFNTTPTNQKWSAINQDVLPGRAGYIYSNKEHPKTPRVVFRLYILNEPIKSCPDGYFFAYDEQDTRKYRNTNNVPGTSSDSTGYKKIYTMDRLFCMDMIGDTRLCQTEPMNVPVSDSSFFYVGYKDDYRAAISGQSLNTGGSHSQFTKIRQLPMYNLPGFYAPAGAYGRMIADTTATGDNIEVKFKPAGYFFRTSSGVNVPLRQVDENTWMAEDMWYIEGAYMSLSGEVVLYTESEFSMADPGARVAGWSVPQAAPDIPVAGHPGQTAEGKYGWPRIYTNNTAPNGAIEFVLADYSHHIHYDNNGHFGEEVPDQYPPSDGAKTVVIQDARLLEGYEFKGWATSANGEVVIFPKDSTTKPLKVGDVIDFDELPSGLTLVDGVLHLYAIAVYKGTINVAISFVKEDGKRYFLTHPSIQSPRYARTRTFTDWTEVRQGLGNAANDDPTYLSSYNILGQEGVCEKCGDGEYVLDPHREIMRGAEDSLVFYADYTPATDEYVGLYYMPTPNTVIADPTWAGLFKSSAGWPTPTTPCITSTRLSSTHYLERDGLGEIQRYKRTVTLKDPESAALPSNIVYNATDDQFDGSDGTGTEFMISGVGVVDAHYVILPDTNVVWRDEIVFDHITDPHPHEVVWSKLIGKHLLAQMKVGDEIIYFHPDRDKTFTTANELRLSSDYRLTENFTFIRDARITTLDDDERPSMEDASDGFSRTIVGGHENPILNTTYQGNYIDIVDTLRITLMPASRSKIKEYYGRWKTGAAGLHVSGANRYRDVLIRTKTYHYTPAQTRLILTPEYDLYTFTPLAGNTRTINFTLTREIFRSVLDAEGHFIREEIVNTEDVTSQLALTSGACSFTSGGGIFGIDEALSQHVTLRTLAENKSADNLDTLLISATVKIDGVDYPATARIPLVQTSLEGDELIWSVYEGGQRYYITAGTGGLIYRKYTESKSILYKEGTTNVALVKGSANAANDDPKYITPWHFRYHPDHSDQLSFKTEYGVNRYMKIDGTAVGIDDDDSSFFSYHYVNIYVNDNANEEEQVKLQYNNEKWLQFTLMGGSGAQLRLVDDEEDASVFSWSYLNREYSLLNKGTYPSRDSVTFGYNRNTSVDVQTRYKAYKEYSMLVGNKIVYLCREEEEDIADLINPSLEWKTSYDIEYISDKRTFDKEDPGDPDPVSGITTPWSPLFNPTTLTTRVSTSTTPTSPMNVTIGGKYVNIVDTLHVTISLQKVADVPEYRFKDKWSSFKSVADAERKIPLIRMTYHAAPYDTLACYEENEEYNHVFSNTINPLSPEAYVFHLGTTRRTGDQVLDVNNTVVAVEPDDEDDVTGLMRLDLKDYAAIQLLDEFGNVPTWCRLGTKGTNTIEVICTESGIRSPRTAYIYIAYFLVIDEKMRFVNYRLAVSQPSLFQYANNQHLVHSPGASGDPLKDGMQQVHENKRILYYYPEQDVELPVRESHFFGWWRWFRESDDPEIGDTDIPEEVWRQKPLNTSTKYSYPFRIIGDSVLIDEEHPELGKKLVTMGRYTVFHYKSSQYPDWRNNPPIKIAKVAPPVATSGVAVKPTVTYAVDISNYYDKLPMSVKDKNQVDTARLDTMTAIPEPTLSLREVFELRPWTEMAERMESYKDTIEGDHIENTRYMEDHVVMAPLNAPLLLPTEQRYNYDNLDAKGHSESLLGYYMRDDNWDDWSANLHRQDTMIWCGGWDADCEWYTYDRSTRTYTPCTYNITQSDDYLVVPARKNIPADTVIYCLRARSWASTFSDATDDATVTSDSGAYMFNICRYKIVYHDKDQYGPKLEETTSGVTKAIITNDEIEQRYEVLERLNFDYNQPGRAYAVYPHPLPWADASYGYTYPETPDLPHNRPHTQSALPNFGEYGLVNRVKYTDYWYDMEQHGGAENGYMIYCDGMSSSGQVAALSLTAKLCSGQKMFFSCYVGNPSNQTSALQSKPNFTFEVQGSEDGETWEDITSYMTGDLDISPKWYQIYFPIIFNEVKEYEHFRVRIYNMASSWNGNDFTLDDMCIFATKPPLIAYQANTACKEKEDEETPTNVLLRVDYQGITGEGYNDKKVYYTVKCVDKERHPSFVPMIDHYLEEETHPGKVVAEVKVEPDTLCGKLFIPDKLYEPLDEDSIFVNMNELIDTFEVSMAKHKDNPSYPIFREGYIYEALEGVTRPVKYVVHSAYMNPRDTFTVHMSAEYKELMSSLCGMTSYLKISNQMVLELNGEEVPETNQDGLCANATYDIGLRVKGSLYLDNTAPISLNGSCLNDWLHYGDTTEAKSLARYGHAYSDIVKVVKDILRCEPPGTTNGNQFAPNLAAVNHNEMLRIQAAQHVEIGGTYEPTPGSANDPYVILCDLVNKGYLTLYQSHLTATVYAGDSVQCVIFPILGTGNDALHDANVEVCPLPILIKLKPDPESAKTPLIVGGLHRDASEMNQPIVVVVSAEASNQEIVLKVDSIMPLVGIRSVDLLSTDDPGFIGGTHTLSFTPDLNYPTEEYYAKGSDIRLRPSTGNNYYMEPGYTYTFGILMQTALGKDTLDGGCPVGTVPFTVSVVPDYLRWDPQDENDVAWNKPGNWLAIDNLNRPLSTNDRFAPLSSTQVIIPAMTDGRPYPEMPDLAVPASYDSVKQVGFTYNTCDAIRFLPGGAISQQQRMEYTNAIVDMPLPYAQWAFRAAPVMGMLSGDLFMADADINYETSPWEVGAFDASGRNYKTGNATYWLSLYSTTAIHKGNGTSTTDETYTADAGWSKMQNGMKISLDPAQGWAVFTRTKATNAAAIRLPKNDDVYYYYDTNGKRMDDLYEHNMQEEREARAVLQGGHAGELAFKPVGTSASYTLTKDASSKTFVFGNPTMGYIDIWGFIADNTSLKAEIGYMASGNKYTTVSQESAEATEDVISNQQRYLPPMHAMLVTLKDAESAATELAVTLNTNRVLTSPAKKVRAGAPAHRAPRQYPQGIMTVTAINSASSRNFSRLLLGQGYHDAMLEGEDALLTTLNIDNYTNNTTPATPFNLYAIEGENGLCIDLRDSIVNIPLSFYMSNRSYAPTTRLWFSGVHHISDALVLYDAVTDTERPISDGAYLDIQTPEQSHEVRYYIRRRGYKQTTGTEVATGFEPTEPETDEVVKFIKNDHVYILRRGQVYTIIGQRVQ